MDVCVIVRESSDSNERAYDANANVRLLATFQNLQRMGKKYGCGMMLGLLKYETFPLMHQMIIL